MKVKEEERTLSEVPAACVVAVAVVVVVVPVCVLLLCTCGSLV